MAGDARSDNSEAGRVNRERETTRTMIGMYCEGNHGGGKDLCNECNHLLNYANVRLDHCPHGENKPTCLKCSIHCYGEEERERIRAVMRYAGPRMLLSHPVMAIRHILDGRKK